MSYSLAQVTELAEHIDVLGVDGPLDSIRVEGIAVACKAYTVHTDAKGTCAWRRLQRSHLAASIETPVRCVSLSLKLIVAYLPYYSFTRHMTGRLSSLQFVFAPWTALR